MGEEKEPAVTAIEKQADSKNRLNLLRAFTLLIEEGKEPVLAARESSLALTLVLTC
jgi:hypothetical protein